eukprot:TRINITY_DN9617_c0_g1_i3.p1 TRINITY_DN9617_c0_g1~~TRINITY_DN9617_c0_g1_i3.p1  ORF type:complete len:105 (+),score=11.10 TRINITY_DN9617_c0_g1_i3:113-427(+)
MLRSLVGSEMCIRDSNNPIIAEASTGAQTRESRDQMLFMGLASSHPRIGSQLRSLGHSLTCEDPAPFHAWTRFTIHWSQHPLVTQLSQETLCAESLVPPPDSSM